MIEFDNVSKRYTIGQTYGSLRERLNSLTTVLWRWPRHARPSPAYHWALRDVSFRVNRGEALGLIGRNGAGKTTTLKLLSKITKPTAGRVSIAGKVATLIELGAGFHADLSGRDNVFLYGTILGLSRAEIERRFDKIVSFAELDNFIETPVKRYSSGMYARLAFSVAAHVDPDVLLVDEVLSVGDSNFRDKCYDFIHSFVHSGRTTVFVSHDAWAVEQLCDRLIWLDQGRVMASGNPSRTVEGYLNFLEERAIQNVEIPRLHQHKMRITGVSLTDAEGNPSQVFGYRDDVVVSVDYETDRPVERPHFAIWVSDSPAPEPLFAANMLIDGQAPECISGPGTVRCVFKNVPLMPRVYYVWVEVWGADRADILYRWQRLGTFRILDPDLLRGVEQKPGLVPFSKLHGPIRVSYEWRIDERVVVGTGLRNSHG